ncbi:MAG: shikimate dehydrogenase [Alphaproteobacteria bacterium]|nr:shikimate dehydrogenase [Alphaproteobacteria bacterium]
MISARTRLFGLVGHPVRHSLSPAMYNELFRRYGLDAVYMAFDVDPDRAEAVGEAIRTLDLVGVNLTVPFKERVLPDLDHITVAAEEAGAVNVVVHVGGVLTGYNTDGEGLMRYLDAQGIKLSGARGVVLGAGGTGRAVASAFLDRGAAGVTLHNRTLSRAIDAVKALERRFGHADLDARPLSEAEFARTAPHADIIVNCTAGGAKSTIAGLDPAHAASGATWVDVNYWMPDPPHQQRCRALGLRFETGLGMLVHQGALAFELFTGHPVEAPVLEEIIRRAIAEGKV